MFVSLSLCVFSCISMTHINITSACNFKINRLSGWRELIDETYFYFYAICHVTNFVCVCVLVSAAQRFMHSFSDSIENAQHEVAEAAAAANV